MKSARLFSEGLAAFHYFDEWGFIDKSGKEIISHMYPNAYHKFKEVQDFSEGLALVKTYDEWFFIDKTGEKVI